MHIFTFLMQQCLIVQAIFFNTSNSTPFHPLNPRRLPSFIFLQALAGSGLHICESIPFIASLLVKEVDDEANVDIILSGIATLNDEVSWFKREASKWGVSLDSIVPQQANLVYCIISSMLESFHFLGKMIVINS